MTPPYPIDRILIAAAMKAELKVLEGSLPEVTSFCCCGVGSRRSPSRIARCIEQVRPALVVFAGTAGQLSPELQSGDVVFPQRWCFRGGRCYGQSEDVSEYLADRGWLPHGVGLTVPRPVLLPSRRQSLYQDSGALVCDMESAGVLAATQELQVPALAIKVVSDTSVTGVVGFWRDLHPNMERLAAYLRDILQVLCA